MVKYLIIAIASFSFLGCAFSQDCVESDSYNLMLKGLLENDVPTLCVDSAAKISNAQFLDAREMNETRVSTIKEAIPVGYDRFSLKSVEDLPKDTLIIVYCSVGYRSEKVTQKLLKAGFLNVYNLYGGIFEWVNNGYPTYQGNTITPKVHAYDKIWGQWLRAGEKIYK